MDPIAGMEPEEQSTQKGTAPNASKKTHHVQPNRVRWQPRKGVKCVKETSHITFSSVDNIFRLYAGNSIYAFCITPELTLEHLHWGEKIPPDYDLRFLNQSSRQTHFTTVEAPQVGAGGKIVMAAESMAEIQKTWRENRIWVPREMSDYERFHRRRLENYSWRLMNLLSQDSQRVKQYLENHGMESKPNGSEGKKSSEDMSSLMTTYSTDNLSSFDQPLGRLQRIHRRNSIAAVCSRDPHCFSSTVPPEKAAAEAAAAFGFMPREPVNAGDSSLASNSLRRSRTIDPHDIKHSHVAIKTISPFSGAPSEGDLLALNTRARKRNSVIPRYHLLEDLDKRLEDLHQRINTHTYDRAIGKLGKGGICLEYSDLGTGDFRTPSFQITDNQNGSSISPLKYKCHRIYQGKLPMECDLPAVNVENMEDASTLVVTMADTVVGLEVDLIYVCIHKYDAITRRVVFRNVDQSDTCSRMMLSDHKGSMIYCGSSKILSKACSATIDFEAESSDFYLLQLSGGWGRERYAAETKIMHDIQNIGSTRGMSSHQHNPFAAVTVGPPNETSGEVRAVSLVYSGNFLIEAQKDEMGRLRLNVGINPMGFQWNIRDGETFCTPEVILVRSGEGLGGVSRTLHRLYLEHLIPPNWSDVTPPVMLSNSDLRPSKLRNGTFMRMLQQATALGVNLIYLDESWFRTRKERGNARGEWLTVMKDLKEELKDICEQVNAVNCKFGIWLGSDMLYDDVALLARHPDWFLYLPETSVETGICTMNSSNVMIDLSHPDAREFLLNAMSRLFSTANIEFVRWDMSRPDMESFTLQKNCQQNELCHRFQVGVYKLHQEMKSRFPNILFEASSAGNGRFDPATLHFSPQLWTSDNTDALVRTKIQYGTSIAYPTRCIGTIISPVPNLVTGQRTRLRTRGLVAMCGTFGFELDFANLSPRDVLLCKRLVELYHDLSPIIRWGDLYRLWNPFKINLAAWMYVSRDKKRSAVFGFSIGSDHWSNLMPRLRLQGLDPEQLYEITEPLPNNITQSSGSCMIIETEVPAYQLGVSSFTLPGSILMTAGLPVKFYTLDDALLFILTAVDNNVSRDSDTASRRTRGA